MDNVPKEINTAFAQQGSSSSNVTNNENRTETSVNSQTETHNEQPTFANILKERFASNFKFPEREQAILFDTIENTQKNEYIMSVGNLIGPRNVIFASRVSNNRVCIYLASKALVDEFINNHGGITLSEKFVQARRLVSPAKRIILSNVSPCLPHEIVESEIKRAGIKTVSQITFISAGLNAQEFKHVLSFRRQVYAILDEKEKLPDSLLIQYKRNTFRIFLSTDEIKCFVCNKIGHIANKCPDNKENQAAGTTETHSSPDITSEKTVSATDLNKSNIESVCDTNTKKRPASSSVELDTVSLAESIEGESGNSKEIMTHKAIGKKFALPKVLKKVKTDPSGERLSVYNELSKIFTEKNSNITFEKYNKFLDEVKGRQDVLEVANSMGLDTKLLFDLLIKSVKITKSSTLRARLKRLLKKIKKTGNVAFPFESDASDDYEFNTSQGYTTDTSEMEEPLSKSSQIHN